MTRRILCGLIVFAVGFIAAKADDHIKPTMWGWVWTLTPEPDFYDVQLVSCPDGSKTTPPWHVMVLYNEDAPLGSFLQERGR